MSLLPPTDLATETGLDGRDGTTRAARVAGDEVETVLSLVQFRVGASAGLAGDVFNWKMSATIAYNVGGYVCNEHTNVSSQHVLDLLLLETTLDDQTPAAVDTAAGTQFREQELHDVIVRPLHALANVGNVGKDGPAVAFTQTLRRRNPVRLGPARQQIRVVALDEREEPRDEELVGNRLRGVVRPDARAGLEVALW